MLETAEKFTPVEKEPAMRQFLLLVGGLRALGEGAHEPRLILDAYLLRSLAVAGYAPALDECAVCGTRVADRGRAGGRRHLCRAARVRVRDRRRRLVCRSCRTPGAATPAPQTVVLMGALMRGDWAHADSSEHRHRAECSGLVAAYLQWHLEHSIRSLRHVEHA